MGNIKTKLQDIIVNGINKNKRSSYVTDDDNDDLYELICEGEFFGFADEEDF